MAAAKQGARGLVELLLAKGADPTARADDGQSAQDLASAEARDLLE
jgi:ankyrin repeat protein